MWLPLLFGCTGETEPLPPTVVWVVVESFRADLVAGSELLPNLDALKEDAVVFTHAHAAAPNTLPSVATILTTEQPWEHRVVADILTADRFGRVSPFSTSVPATWRRRGHRTGGWASTSDVSERFGMERGFDHWDERPNDPARLHRTGDETVRSALDWLAKDDEPAYAFIHIADPAFNYAPDSSCRGRFSDEPAFELPVDEERFHRWRSNNPPTDAEVDYVRRLYAEQISCTDEAIGTLVAGLREQGRLDDSLLVITGDHGEELWDVSGVTNGHNVRSILTHVPLVVRMPGLEPHENDTTVGHAEVARALLDLSGPVWDWMVTGETVSGRKAWSSSPSRTLDRLSWIDDTHRATLSIESRTMVVWQLDERGWEAKVARTYSTESQTWAAPEFTPMLELREDPFMPIVPTRPWLAEVTPP